MDTKDGAVDMPKVNGTDSPNSNTVFIRVSLPDTGTQECLQFQLDEAVGAAKQQVIDRLGRSLKDPLNYGFYSPPINGRAAKFLEEERPLRDYPLPGPIGFLEFKYKLRVYRSVSLSQTKLKKLHTKANLRQFLEYVKMRNVVKVTKYTQKGIDPNFHCRQTGETPLTLAVKVAKPRELIMALVSGGGHLDFRARDSFTPLHRAAVNGCSEAITTLLDLGQSPNCRTLNGLTPLYYMVSTNTESTCSDRLLFEHSILGVTDSTGAQEIHQACRGGRVQHLQNLISYGADLDAQDNEGNTALHVCALGPQDSCARLLLFRGADRTVTNTSGHSPYQVAILKGHADLAELIKNYSDADVVRIKGSPNFNRRRRTSIPSLRFNSLRTASLHNLHAGGAGDNRASGGTMPSTGGPRSRTGLGVSASVGKSMGNLAMGDSEERGVNEFTLSWGQNSMDDDSIAGSSLRGFGNRPHPTGSLHYDVPNTRPSLLPLLHGDVDNYPRAVVLQRGSKGFGFVLRGAKGANALDFKPTPEIPALQYFEKIDQGTPAAKAGLLDGDFILEINGTNVVECSHERAVQLIRKAGDTLALKVLTVNKAKLQQQMQSTAIEQLDKTLATYDVSSMGSLRSQEGKTASIRARASRNITENELQEVFARAGRPELPGHDGIKPEIVAAPKIYSNEDDIKARLKANRAAHNEAESHYHNPRTGPSTFRPQTIPTTAVISEPPPEKTSFLPRHGWEPNDSPAQPHHNQYGIPDAVNGSIAVNNDSDIEELPDPPPPQPLPDYSDSDPEPENRIMYARPKPRDASPPPTSTASVASSGSGSTPSESGGLKAMLAAAVAKRELQRKVTESEAPPPPPAIYANPSQRVAPPPPPPVPKTAPPPPPAPLASAPKKPTTIPPPPPPPPPPVAVPPLVVSTPVKSNATPKAATASSAGQIEAAALTSARSNLRSVPSVSAEPAGDVALRSPRSEGAGRPPSEDHNAVLKAVIEQRRQLIEAGSNPAEKIETRLRNTRQLPKSMVFGTTPATNGPPVEAKPAPLPGRQVAAKSMVFAPTTTATNQKQSPPPMPAAAANKKEEPAVSSAAVLNNNKETTVISVSKPSMVIAANQKPSQSPSANQKPTNKMPSQPAPANHTPSQAASANQKPSVPVSVNQKPSVPVVNQKPSVPAPTRESGPKVTQASLATSAPAPPRPVAALSSDRQTSFLVQAEQLRRQMLERRQNAASKAPPPPPPLKSPEDESLIVPPPDSFADLAASSPSRNSAGGGRGNSMFFGAAAPSSATKPKSPAAKNGADGHISML